MKTNLRIGEVLMERNYITQEQMEQALAYQKEHREKRVRASWRKSRTCLRSALRTRASRS